MNKQKKRERLLVEGLRLFLEAGYERASIEQIAAAADVARGTFYLYFSDKLSLFQALVDRWLQPLLAVFQDVDAKLASASSPLESMAIYLAMAQSIADVSLSHRDEVLLVFREMRGAHEAGLWMRQREIQLHEAATTITEHAMRRGLIEVDDPRLAALLILGASERLHYEFLVGGNIGDTRQLPAKVMQLFGRMLGLPQG